MFVWDCSPPMSEPEDMPACFDGNWHLVINTSKTLPAATGSSTTLKDVKGFLHRKGFHLAPLGALAVRSKNPGSVFIILCRHSWLQTSLQGWAMMFRVLRFETKQLGHQINDRNIEMRKPRDQHDPMRRILKAESPLAWLRIVRFFGNSFTNWSAIRKQLWCQQPLYLLRVCLWL